MRSIRVNGKNGPILIEGRYISQASGVRVYAEIRVGGRIFTNGEFADNDAAVQWVDDFLQKEKKKSEERGLTVDVLE